MKRYFFTDGSCRGNPGPGGFGVVEMMSDKNPLEIEPGDPYYFSLFCRGRYENTTNNRMEMQAILEVLQYAAAHSEDEFIIYTDSAYCTNMINDWIENWANNNWLNSKGREVENKDLVLKIWEYVNRPSFNVEIIRIKGHCGIFGNELADRLANNDKAGMVQLNKKYSK
jgi:ribonuclease HI